MFKTFTLKCTDNRYSSVCGLRSVSEMFGIPDEDQRRVWDSGLLFGSGLRAEGGAESGTEGVNRRGQ